ncbi:4-hydroxy-3-methylbut-2-enyl diphosphate reductase [Candidatus Woesearchaeota archaeon]|nr:4-hydroxy-3-methylbut-2-enyl diphosphate reductase [Candidatus Woesearchaeota archaeon]
MHVHIAKGSGFCFGVKRAVDIALNAPPGTAILGELVHNSHVTVMLEKKGVITVCSVKEALEAGGISNLIIRAHGEPALTYEKAASLNIIDATCPNVRQVQDLAKRLEKSGKKVIIFGKKDHAEVRGIAGSLEKPVILEDPLSLKDMPLENTAIVFQTTQADTIFKEVRRVLSGLEEQGGLPEIHNTLCPVTSDRQRNAEKLAEKMDMMIVVGGFHSSNTARLAERCSYVTETHHVENSSQLEKGWFKGRENVGIAAGASTPDAVIDGVVQTIRSWD